MNDDLAKLLDSFTGYIHDNILMEILKSQDYIEEPQRLIYTFLFKTNNSLSAISGLLATQRLDYHNSVMILIRPILTDIFTIETVMKYDDLGVATKRLYADHVERQLNFIERFSAVNFNWNERKIKNEKVSLLNQYPHLLREDESLMKPLEISPEKFVNNMLNKKKNISNKEKIAREMLKQAYSAWYVFSKYEHFGAFTFGLTHNYIFDAAALQELNKSIKMSLAVISFYMRLRISLWQGIIASSKEQLEKFTEKFQGYIED